MRRPRPLQPGDAIGVIAPASPVDVEAMEAGLAVIEARGYRIVRGEHLLDTVPDNDFLAGRDADRARDVQTMFARDDIAAIFCAKGGYGAMRVLRLLDWLEIAAHPKIFVGYSDITSLHLALNRRGEFVTFHGPNVQGLSKLDATSSEVFWKMLEDPAPFGILPAPCEAMQTVVPGIAEGILTGGCLTLLAHACGSEFAPDFAGCLVLMEDVGEQVYRVDRYLAQLNNAGLLAQAAGFVIGTISNWRKQEADPPHCTPDALWRDLPASFGKPIVSEFPFGHEPNPLTLPFGVRARLDADAKTLTLLESALLA